MTTTDTFLSDEEVRALTQRKVRRSQVQTLKAMGIEHRVRPDGSVAILRNHINKVFDGSPDSGRKTKSHQPNWDAMSCRASGAKKT
jgi:hypothetical protein